MKTAFNRNLLLQNRKLKLLFDLNIRQVNRWCSFHARLLLLLLVYSHHISVNYYSQISSRPHFYPFFFNHKKVQYGAKWILIVVYAYLSRDVLVLFTVFSPKSVFPCLLIIALRWSIGNIISTICKVGVRSASVRKNNLSGA
ncbi:hypothetical protein H5410_029626 [Solanum commersonii]|uniref:Uncharacterized protein n=1 Tax=Solanum commersonii TaxID=4109 RepID=A0A9J5YF57_SOLCO|nr:hypothetical protein H5410_029626 [Solanum commersonii]